MSPPLQTTDCIFQPQWLLSVSLLNGKLWFTLFGGHLHSVYITPAQTTDPWRLFLITCLMRQHGKCQRAFLTARFASLEMEERSGGKAHALKQIPNAERKEMVNYCRVFGCTNQSDHEKHLEFYRLPKVITNQGEQCQKLSEERRRLWLAKLNQDLRGKKHPNLFDPFLVR